MLPLLITLLYVTSGCGPNYSAESRQSSEVRHKTSPLTLAATIDQVTNKGFAITVSNDDAKPMCLDTYYFGYRLTAVYPGGIKRVIDYGADKVPIGYDADWHVLTRGQSFTWFVAPPTSWNSLDEATEITYEYTMRRNPPLHITTDPRKIETYSLLAEWAKYSR
ncbi:MAG: hypothetical protein AB7V39_24850 [Nitrospiraceae bacterium]